MTEYPLLLEGAALRVVRAGKGMQIRRLASSPLRACRPGDRLWLKEGCSGGRRDAGGREISAKIGDAAFVVFADGWRQYRDGSGHAGAVPTSKKLVWTPAIHMPRWACRTALIVERVRIGRLQAIGREDIRAEGQFAVTAGLFWRWHPPVRGVWRDPHAAFAALWNATHGTDGERWEDDPDVVILAVRSAPGIPASASH